MWVANVAVFILHALSFAMSVWVCYKLYRCEVLPPMSKYPTNKDQHISDFRIFLWTMFSSFFCTDIFYSYAVYLKMQQGEILFVFADVLKSGPCSIPILIHDIGFSVFTVSILLTALDRLLTSKSNFPKQHAFLSVIIALAFVVLGIFVSYFWALKLLDNTVHIYAASIGVAAYVVAILLLFLTLRSNVRRYKRGIGESLDRRFNTAAVYYFNRSLFRSLLGNVICRLVSFACIFVITTGTYDDLGFGWLSFFYHNMLAVGNILFPPLIDFKARNIRRVKSSTLNGNKVGPSFQDLSGVRDLTGNSLKLREHPEEHFNTIHRMWN